MREPGAPPAAEAVTVVDCGGSVCLRVGAPGATARHASARGRTENYRVASGVKQVRGWEMFRVETVAGGALVVAAGAAPPAAAPAQRARRPGYYDGKAPIATPPAATWVVTKVWGRVDAPKSCLALVWPARSMPWPISGRPADWLVTTQAATVAAWAARPGAVHRPSGSECPPVLALRRPSGRRHQHANAIENGRRLFEFGPRRSRRAA